MIFSITSCSSLPIGTSVQVETVIAADAPNEVEISDEKEPPETANTTFSVRNTISAAGQVLATTINKIYLEFPAGVEKVSVKEGQRVKSGDTLLTLNLREYESQIKSMELDIQSLKSETVRIRNEYFSSNSAPDIRLLLNDLQTAEELYDNGRKELSDKQKLFEAGSISKNELEEFENQVADSKKEVDNINLSIDSLKAGKQDELNTNERQITKLESDLTLMKDKLNKSFIKKNVVFSNVKNGVVFDIAYTDGDIIAPGTKVLSVLDLDSLIVKADVPEKNILDVKVGTSVVMIPYSDNSKQYEGTVMRISSLSVLKEEEAYIPIEISIINKDNLLLPNSFVDVKIKLDEKADK